MANIKLRSEEIKALQKCSGERTGQKAVRKAVLYFIKEARQRRITNLLHTIYFTKGFDPLKLRHNER